MSPEQTLIKRLDRLRAYAVRAEWDDVAAFLGGHVKELRKTDRERPWPLGRCIWCEIDANRLREATIPDSGGGAPMCEEHFDEMMEAEREAARAA